MSYPILDEEGRELLFWPVGGVKSGENSQTLRIQVYCGPGLTLACAQDDRATFFGRVLNTGSFVDLAQDPIDLSGLGAGYVMFEVYIHAFTGLTDSSRVPLSAGPVGQSAAGWTA